LFLPLPWLSDCVPRVLAARYRWDAAAARLEELAAPVAASTAVASTPVPTAAVAAPNPMTGLRQRHGIVIDPGHGGPDPGNPGRHVPGGLVEKDIALSVGRLLRAELTRRGITASLTRQTDTLIDLADRGAFCRAECDLFVSIHVNAMPPGRRPAILGERGFATNPTDGAFRASALGQHKLASAIADGIVAYLLELERKRAVGAPAGGRCAGGCLSSPSRSPLPARAPLPTPCGAPGRSRTRPVRWKPRAGRATPRRP